MDTLLTEVIASLTLASSRLEGDAGSKLRDSLHSTECLPNQNVLNLANDALNLLDRVRQALDPGHCVLADHFLGYMNTKALCAAVELNIADRLGNSSKTLETLAETCNARSDRLRQILQLLYNAGIFSYNARTGLYSNNHVSTLLQTDHWTQWHNWVNLYGNEFYDMARGIPLACRRDAIRSPAQINYDTDDSMFQYFTDRGWIEKFHKTLSGGAIAQAPGILEDYPWHEVADGLVIDLGGGGGGFVALLLRKFSTMTGMVVDRPAVIEQARKNFHDANGMYGDVRHQMPIENLQIGDFFEKVPASDVYTMKWCLHDWDNEKASTILKCIRRSIQRSHKSRLIIVEAVLADGYTDRISRYADMNMMVAVSGKERNEAQWTHLAAASGWKISRIHRLRGAWPSAIELLPEWNMDDWVADANSVSAFQPRCITAEMRFLEDWDGRIENPHIRIAPEPGFSHMNFEWVDCSVNVNDARPTRDDFNLDAHGFAYFDDAITPELIQAIRARQGDVTQKQYYAHVHDFVKKITGAERVIIFDHTLRKRRQELTKTQNDDGKEQPATMVHCDQSEKGALRRLQMNLAPSEDIEDVLRGRVQMLNVWRPLNGPVLDWPLATMDYQTMQSKDMHACDLFKGAQEERGQTVTFCYSDQQKWYYLDRHQTDEVTVIKIWDNSNNGASKYCAHAAFQHTDCPPDIVPRESIEVRCIVTHAPAS